MNTYAIELARQVLAEDRAPTASEFHTFRSALTSGDPAEVATLDGLLHEIDGASSARVLLAATAAPLEALNAAADRVRTRPELWAAAPTLQRALHQVAARDETPQAVARALLQIAKLLDEPELLRNTPPDSFAPADSFGPRSW